MEKVCLRDTQHLIFITIPRMILTCHHNAIVCMHVWFVLTDKQ